MDGAKQEALLAAETLPYDELFYINDVQFRKYGVIDSTFSTAADIAYRADGTTPWSTEGLSGKSLYFVEDTTNPGVSESGSDYFSDDYVEWVQNKYGFSDSGDYDKNKDTLMYKINESIRRVAYLAAQDIEVPKLFEGMLYRAVTSADEIAERTGVDIEATAVETNATNYNDLTDPVVAAELISSLSSRQSDIEATYFSASSDTAAAISTAADEVSALLTSDDSLNQKNMDDYIDPDGYDFDSSDSYYADLNTFDDILNEIMYYEEYISEDFFDVVNTNFTEEEVLSDEGSSLITKMNNYNIALKAYKDEQLAQAFTESLATTGWITKDTIKSVLVHGSDFLRLPKLMEKHMVLVARG